MRSPTAFTSASCSICSIRAVTTPSKCSGVLKCPDHVFALDAVRSVYPDARIVFLHRDPLKVLPSVAKLTEILRNPFTERQDLSEIGAQVTSRWHQGVEAMMRAADSNEGGSDGRAGAICHVHYRDLTADPLGTIARLYAHFDMPLGDAAVRGITAEINRETRGGYARNVYRFADHGLDAPARAWVLLGIHEAFRNRRGNSGHLNLF